MFDKSKTTYTSRPTNFIINTPNLRSLDNEACMQLINRHLQARQLEGGWLAVKHDCACPHIHVVHEPESRQPITIRRRRHDK
ncbi:hypothetical protein D9M72_28000 [compost metagenome]